MGRKLILVSGPGLSGTHLIARLFDEHPQLAVYPNQFHFLDAILESKTIEHLRALCLERVSRNEYVAGYHIVPFNDGYNSLQTGLQTYTFKIPFDRENFVQRVKAIEAVSPSDFFFKFSDLYFLSWGIDSTRSHVVIQRPNKEAESVRIGKEYFEDFRCLVMVRAPEQVLASRKRANKKNKGLVNALYCGIGFKKAVSFRDNCVFHVSYRAIINQDIDHFDDICDFLEISKTDVFPQPTVFGDRWSGHSIQRTGIEDTSKEYKEILTRGQTLMVRLGYNVSLLRCLPPITNWFIELFHALQSRFTQGYHQQ